MQGTPGIHSPPKGFSLGYNMNNQLHQSINIKTIISTFIETIVFLFLENKTTGTLLWVKQKFAEEACL